MKIFRQSLLKELITVTEALITSAHHFQSEDLQHLTQKSAPEKWNVLECLEHLNAYSRYYIPAISKALQSAENTEDKEYYNSGWFGQLCINSVKIQAEGTMRFKIKAFSDYNPQKFTYQKEDVLQEFIHHQQQTLFLLEQSKRRSLAGITIPISIAKRLQLNLGDALQFLIYHNQRHIVQAQKAFELPSA